MNACFWDSDSVIFDRNKDFAILFGGFNRNR